MTRFYLFLVLALSACSTLTLSTTATPKDVKLAYLQDCTKFGQILPAVTAALAAGKITAAEFPAINSAVQTAGNACTGPVPTDPTAVAGQLSAAVTTLTLNAAILEMSKK